MEPDNNLLNEQQAARYLGVTSHTLSKWRNKGRGPKFIRIGHRLVRYDQQTLREWVASCTVAPERNSEVA